MTIREFVAGYSHSVLSINILTTHYDNLADIRPRFDDPEDDDLKMFDRFADLQIQKWCLGSHGQIMVLVDDHEGIDRLWSLALEED